MDFKKVEKQYRPIPFWSWNDKLNENETTRQVHVMDKAGMGGFFMHARGGLQTEYMGDEWFDNVTSAIKTAIECGMRPWAYDENGWPSGFGNETVTGLGVAYQQKYLRMESKPEHNETAICKSGDHWFYYDINPFYVDVLDQKVIKAFIENIYQSYYEKCGNQIEGFFTDEPQISRNGIPWSFVFEEEYKRRYGEDIKDHLEELFLEIKDYKNTRFQFWKMVTDLFSSAYMKQIYDWCDERGLKLTGHLVLEETLYKQLITNGACMPHYEYFHIPGVDWLGRGIYDCLTTRQVGSVAAQLGKKQVLSETFACCGHNVSFDELKGLFEWQMVRGVNLLCQHLEGYSVRGLRKRDYPPAMYHQQPWWDGYEKFIDAMSRLGKVMSCGEEKVSTLVLHPMTSAWILYNDSEERKEIDELHERFLGVMKQLEQKHIEFHLGDETIMERHAYVEDGCIVIGNQRYDTLILPLHQYLFPSTEKMIAAFLESGGKIVTPDELLKNNVIDNENITYTKRCFDGYTVHYFVNSTGREQEAMLGVAGKRMDIYTGELLEQTKKHCFEPWGSLLLVEDGSDFGETVQSEINVIYPQGKYKVSEKVENTLLLDRCDYYFDGVLEETNGYILNIAERANKLERKVAIRQDYHVKMEYIPDSLHLVCETPEKFEIAVNGKTISKEYCGTFVDTCFQRIEISQYLCKGENVITFFCDFMQSEDFYQKLKKAYLFESEKNKLSYDMEIEAVMLVGDFSVRTEGDWVSLEHDAYRYNGDFVITKPVHELELCDIQKQGFPFFCGKLKVEKEVELGERTILKVNRKGVNVLRVEIDEKSEVILTGNDEINLSQLAGAGTHSLKLTLTNNLRNLLGPHHLKEGECFVVCPSSFYKESCVWSPDAEENWNEAYCFTSFGIL